VSYHDRQKGDSGTTNFVDKEVDMLFRSYVIALVVLSIVAGLVSFIVVALIDLAVRKLKRRDRPSREPGLVGNDRRSWTAVLKSRHAIVAFPLGFALGAYLILDLEFSISVYLRFTTIYAAFWALVSLLLLRGSPTRHKLLTVGLLAVALFSLRFIDWNSRKPFLKDFYRIEEGMTAAQVEEIMGDYMTGGGVPLGSPGTRLDGRLVGQGASATGTISYRHTNEGWGDSDWGVVTFENGLVVGTRFSPD
jgi:amino acid transporter